MSDHRACAIMLPPVYAQAAVIDGFLHSVSLKLYGNAGVLVATSSRAKACMLPSITSAAANECIWFQPSLQECNAKPPFHTSH